MIFPVAKSNTLYIWQVTHGIDFDHLWLDAFVYCQSSQRTPYLQYVFRPFHNVVNINIIPFCFTHVSRIKPFFPQSYVKHPSTNVTVPDDFTLITGNYMESDLFLFSPIRSCTYRCEELMDHLPFLFPWRRCLRLIPSHKTVWISTHTILSHRLLCV